MPRRLSSVVALAVAALVVAGCSAEEGARAQELLERAEAAQAQLRSATFDGSVVISLDEADIRMQFEGASSTDGEWFSLRTSGVPGGGDVGMQVLVRGDDAWLNIGGGWQELPTAATGSGETMSAAAFHELARYVKDVRVTEHQQIGGKPVTTIAGDIDTEAMIRALAKLGSFAEGASLDFSELGLALGDIHAVLTIDERSGLLDSAFITFDMAAEGKNAEIELRYRLGSTNRPVELPSASG